jgi:hypothetical protein
VKVGNGNHRRRRKAGRGWKGRRVQCGSTEEEERKSDAAQT